MERMKVQMFCKEASNRPNHFNTFTFDDNFYGHLVAHIKDSVFVAVLEKLLPDGLSMSEVTKDTYSITGINSKFQNPMKVFSACYVIQTEKIALQVRVRFGTNEIIESFRGYGENNFIKVGELVARKSFSLDYFDFQNAKFEHSPYYRIETEDIDEPNFKIEDMWIK